MDKTRPYDAGQKRPEGAGYSAGPEWKVHVWTCGHYAGSYEFKSRNEAIADAAERRRKFGVLGCAYSVARADVDLRCRTIRRTVTAGDWSGGGRWASLPSPHPLSISASATPPVHYGAAGVGNINGNNLHTKFDYRMIYLASPYWSDSAVVRNNRYRSAVKATAAIMRKTSQTVFSPIVHSHPLGDYGLAGRWEFWEKHDRWYLERAAVVFVLTIEGWIESRGVSAEIDIAKHRGIPIRYLNLDDAFVPGDGPLFAPVTDPQERSDHG